MNTWLPQSTRRWLISCAALVVAFSTAPSAQTTAPESVSLRTTETEYYIGEPVEVTVTLTNGSQTAQQYAPIMGLSNVLKFRVVGPEGGERDPLSAHGSPVSVWVGLDWTQTPVGGTKDGRVLLSHYYDLTATGTYTATVQYPIEEFVATSEPGGYRIEVDGYREAETTFSVGLPPEPESEAAQSFADAFLAQMDGALADPSDVYRSIAADHPESYLAESSRFYLSLFYQQLGARSRRTDTGWQQEAERLAREFVNGYPASPLAPYAVTNLLTAKARLSPPLDGAVRPWNIGAEGLCGGTVFRVVNANDQPVSVQYVATGGGATGVVDLAPASERFVTIRDPGQAVRFVHDGGVVSIAFANDSTCPAVLASPFPDLPAALTLSTPSATATLNGNPFLISGHPHALDGEPEEGEAVHAVFASTADAQQAVLGALAPQDLGSVVGRGGEGDVALGPLGFDPAALAETLLDHETDRLPSTFSGSIGTPEAPVVAYAPDDLRLSGNLSGYGVLVVDGTFEERGGVDWVGLVVVRASSTNAPPSFVMSGNVTITGGVILVNPTDTPATVSISGRSEIRYSPEALAGIRTAFFPGS